MSDPKHSVDPAKYNPQHMCRRRLYIHREVRSDTNTFPYSPQYSTVSIVSVPQGSILALEPPRFCSNTLKS